MCAYMMTNFQKILNIPFLFQSHLCQRNQVHTMCAAMHSRRQTVTDTFFFHELRSALGHAEAERWRNQGGIEGNWKEKAVEKRKFPLSEADRKAKKQQRGEVADGQGSQGTGGGVVKNKRAIAKYQHNRQRSQCKPCGGSNICKQNHISSRCTQCGGSSICEHNRIRSTCKQCGGSSISEHSRERSRCKRCGGASICEHNRRRSKCEQCGGSRTCPPKKRVLAMRRVEHLRAQPLKKQVQALRWVEHLRAQPPKILLQAMLWAGNLRAQRPKEKLQGLQEAD